MRKHNALALKQANSQASNVPLASIRMLECVDMCILFFGQENGILANVI